MTWSDRFPLNPILALILVAYLIIGGLYAAYTPPWQAPDEPAHYNYVRHLAEKGSLPVLRPGDYPHAYLEQIKSVRFPAHMSLDPIRYEFWQPPLYYILATPLYSLFDGALPPLRLFSVVLGAGVVLSAYAIAQTVRPGDEGLALGAAAFVAFVPMHLTMLASVNNDALAELLLAVVMLSLIRWAHSGSAVQPRRYGHLALTGLLLGLGLVTKATVYVAIPLAFIVLMLEDSQPKILAKQALALFGPALLLATPWYVRNIVLYGWPDLLGMRNHDAVVVGQLRAADYLADVGWTAYLRNFVTTSFHSFWGQFGWMAVPMAGWAYLALGMLSGLALAGWVLILWKRRQTQESTHKSRNISSLSQGSVLLGLWLILTVVVYLYYNATLVQFQGRYLFPALIPIGLLAARGLRKALRKSWAWLGAGVCGMIGIGSALGGGLDNWSLLIVVGATTFLAVRRWLPDRFTPLIESIPYAGMAMLATYSVFGFIVPYLSP
jgi:4-amino-4-deoxy-L-arabinose transferase-like glycosyltransferase